MTAELQGLVQALKNMEQRLQSLEERLARLEKGSASALSREEQVVPRSTSDTGMDVWDPSPAW